MAVEAPEKPKEGCPIHGTAYGYFRLNGEYFCRRCGRTTVK